MSDQVQPVGRVAGLPAGVVPGGLGNRFAAYLIDSVVPAFIGLLAGMVVVQTSLSPMIVGAVSSVLIVGWGLLVWWMFAVGAAGPGMRLMRLQLVGLADGRAIGWVRFLLRQLILFGLALTGIGLLIMVIFLVQHPRRQGWHDRAVSSVVIRERQPPRRAAPSGRSAMPRTAAQPAGSATAANAQLGSSPAPLTPPASPQVSPVQLSPPPGYPAPPTHPPASPPSPVQRPASPPSGYPAPPPHTPASPPPPTHTPASPPPPVQRPASPPPPVQRPASPPSPVRLPSSPPPPVQLPASAPPPSPSAGTGSWHAVLDDGREIAVDGLVLLGRNPQARPGEEHAMLIKVADTTRTVSKSHLEIGLNSRGVYVVDRGSTNGSRVTGMSGVSKRCAPGDPVQVEPGSIVSFGDHWLEVRRG